MPELIYGAIASVDGYVADRGGNFGAAGQRLAEVFAGRETGAMRPRRSPATLDFVRIWRTTEAIVHPQLERGLTPNAVRRLKAPSDQPLSVGGDAAAAFRAGLVDELRLLVAPVVVGSDCPLDLLSVRRFSGFVHLHYAVDC